MRQGRRGVVEAVTGTGKTMVGIAATIEALRDGGKVQIVVPTVELLRQWTVNLSRWLPPGQVGQLGDGEYADWKSKDVIVSVINSARRYDLGSPGRNALLVADECHRYGSVSNALALDERFDRRLGLSATYARADDGNATYLEPYFGDTCFRMDYRRAIADEVTAHFKVALVGVPFAPGERERYDEANSAAWEAQKWLIERGYAAEEPFGEFMKDVSTLAQGEHGRATWKARSFLSNFTERRRILAESPLKREYLAKLLPALGAADRSIIFTQTVEAAGDAVSVINASQFKAEAIHSKMGSDDRRKVLARFASGQLRIISAPQVLDEGVDVPAADLAVILSASRTRRQMIQRMGRVLRRKDDGRLARFVVMYVEGSSEDPALGAHADFLDDITDVADKVAEFKVGSHGRDICAFLNDYLPDRPQGSPRMAITPGPTRTPSGAALSASSGPVRAVTPTRQAGSKSAESSDASRSSSSASQGKQNGVKKSKSSPGSGGKRSASRDRNKKAGRSKAGTGMNQKRLKRIYSDAGMATSTRRSEFGPVIYKLGHLSNEAIVHALRLTRRPDEVRALAETYVGSPTSGASAAAEPSPKRSN